LEEYLEVVGLELADWKVVDREGGAMGAETICIAELVIEGM